MEDQDAQVDPVIQEDPEDLEERESQEETADQGLEDQGDPVDHVADQEGQARSTGTQRNMFTENIRTWSFNNKLLMRIRYDLSNII